jgi:hypothetical protein
MPVRVERASRRRMKVIVRRSEFTWIKYRNLRRSVNGQG